MSDKTDGDIATSANAARQMLESAVFNEAFESMNQSIIDQIVTTPPEAADERERLYAMFKAGQLFVQQFAALINQHELKTQDSAVVE